MDIYSSIFSRRSTRKFDMTPLDPGTIGQIGTFISGVAPLLPGAEFGYKIVGQGETKGIGVHKAPHYMLISGKEQPLRNVCAGFLFQHAELYLHSMGLAACWLAGVRGKEDDPDHILGLAFGRPAGPATRQLSEFDRKPMAEIAEGTDPRLEAVRLAPSGLNKQPWYFIVNGSDVHVYYKKSIGGLMGRMYKLTDLDAGLALCHLAVASEHEGRPFRFNTERKDAPAPPKNFVYIGTAE